jgi:hypothetical protein
MPYSLYLFLNDKSKRKKWRNFREDIEEDWVQVLELDSLHVQIYTCWKLGFVTNPKTSSKHVFKINLRSDVGLYMWARVDLGYLCGPSF